jgi:hypothetical protein
VPHVNGVTKRPQSGAVCSTAGWWFRLITAEVNGIEEDNAESGAGIEQSAAVKAGRQGIPPFADFVRLKKRRHAIAHDGAIYTTDGCLSDINAIEQQLKEWNFIP